MTLPRPAPAEVLAVAPAVKDPKNLAIRSVPAKAPVMPAESTKILWVSPKYSRGSLRFGVADLNGDGREEIILTTRRWCEGKGQLIVFERAVKKPKTPVLVKPKS